MSSSGEGRQFIVLSTLNDYHDEGLEPGIPSLPDRIRTFTELSSMIGRARLSWRFDPLLLSDTLSVEELLCRIGSIGDRIAPYAGRLVISFIDIDRYPRVRRTLAASGISGIREFSGGEIRRFASGLSQLNEEWDLEIQACGEGVDLSRYGISRGECISYDLLAREFSQDPALMDFLRPPDRIRSPCNEKKRAEGSRPAWPVRMHSEQRYRALFHVYPWMQVLLCHILPLSGRKELPEVLSL